MLKVPAHTNPGRCLCGCIPTAAAYAHTHASVCQAQCRWRMYEVLPLAVPVCHTTRSAWRSRWPATSSLQSWLPVGSQPSATNRRPGCSTTLHRQVQQHTQHIHGAANRPHLRQHCEVLSPAGAGQDDGWQLYTRWHHPELHQPPLAVDGTFMQPLWRADNKEAVSGWPVQRIHWARWEPHRQLVQAVKTAGVDAHRLACGWHTQGTARGCACRSSIAAAACTHQYKCSAYLAAQRHRHTGLPRPETCSAGCSCTASWCASCRSDTRPSPHLAPSSAHPPQELVGNLHTGGAGGGHRPSYTTYHPLAAACVAQPSRRGLVAPHLACPRVRPTHSCLCGCCTCPVYGPCRAPLAAVCAMCVQQHVRPCRTLSPVMLPQSSGYHTCHQKHGPILLSMHSSMRRFLQHCRQDASHQCLGQVPPQAAARPPGREQGRHMD